MSATVFTGPILAGTVLQSDGSGVLAGSGSSAGVQNTGFATLAQVSENGGSPTTAFTQAGTTTGTALGITIPAGSMITDIWVYVTAAFSATATLSIGTTSASSNELVSVIPNASLVVGQFTAAPQTGSGGATQVANWLNVGTTDVNIYAKSSATGTGTFFVVVSYIQGANNYINGQYT